MRFIRYYAALLLGVLCLASCQDSMSICSTDLSGSTSVMIDGSGCQSLQCVGAQLDCNQNATDGCETNVLGDVNNCGSCGYKCATPAVGEATCENGVCGVTTCSARYKDCNGNTADSCETDTNRDANNCGGCGNVCGGGANAVGVCVQGKCQLSCQGLYLDCDGDAANGCEVNGASDLANCGNCGNACTKVGATTPACSAGSCTSTVCTGAYRTCKAGPVNGCETDTATNAGNCGTCGKVCGAVANGVAGCAASNCGIASCNANFDNCDGVLANGCEINTSTNIAHCGGCGKACPAYANAVAQCKTSACSMGACNAGYLDCNMNSTDGCEKNGNNDNNNCGQCGKVCASPQFCSGGNCITDPCINYGGTRLIVNPNIRICNTGVGWGKWDPALIPAPWTVCTIPQWASYAPSSSPQSLGLGTLWINNSSCGTGYHREVYVSYPMNDANCYNGSSCCHADSNLYQFAVCSP
ncbi:MAG: hypothetical protein U0745_20980 [Polyangia bacterium]